MNTHKESATGFLVIAASSFVLVISSLTTFGFFNTYFPGIVSSDIVGPQYGRLISGLVGVMLFDLATVVWLLTFLHKSETSEQRAIALIMTFLCFGFSAIASAAHMYLSASNFALDATTRATLENVSTVAVIVGVVANFGAWTAYSRYSVESKQKVRESDRRDMLQAAEDEQSAYLDRLIAQKVKEQLSARADDLAGQQATRLAGRFVDLELTKYAPTEAETVAAVSSPPLRVNGASGG